MARLRIVADLERIAATDGNAYINGHESQLALDLLRQRRAAADDCRKKIFDRQIRLLEENRCKDVYFEVRELYDRCVDIDILAAISPLIRISDKLKKIAARSNGLNLIDLPQERKSAIEFLRSERAKTIDDDQRSSIDGALRILTDPKFNEYPVIAYEAGLGGMFANETNPLLGLYSYLNMSFSRLSQIAREGANPIVLDSQTEKGKAVKYLRKIRPRLTGCEQRYADASIEHICESLGGLQLRYPGNIIGNDPCCKGPFSDVIACFVSRAPWLKMERSLFTDLKAGTFISYNSPRRVKVGNPAKFLDTMGVQYEKIALTREEWDKMVLPLKRAKSPEDERRALLRIILASREFPASEDCILQSETANEILGFISAAGLLKYHDYEPDSSIASHPNESHFAIIAVEKTNRRRWVLDTWETLRNHATSIMTYEDWIGRRHTQPL